MIMRLLREPPHVAFQISRVCIAKIYHPVHRSIDISSTLPCATTCGGGCQTSIDNSFAHQTQRPTHLEDQRPISKDHVRFLAHSRGTSSRTIRNCIMQQLYAESTVNPTWLNSGYSSSSSWSAAKAIYSGTRLSFSWQNAAFSKQ